MDAFKRIHFQQLHSVGFPDNLWQPLFEKLSNDVLDGGEYFEFAINEAGEYFVQVKEGVHIPARADIFLIDHAWTTTIATAKKQLKTIPGLMERMENLMNINAGEIDEEEEEEGEEEQNMEEEAEAEGETEDTKEGEEDENEKKSAEDDLLSVELSYKLMSMAPEDFAKYKEVRSLDLQGMEFSDLQGLSKALSLLPNLETIILDVPCSFLFHYIPSLQTVNGFTRSDNESRVNKVYDTMWRYNQNYSMGSSDGEEEANVWYVMDELGSRIKHGEREEVNIKTIPFFFNDRSISYSLCWPLSDLHGGEAIVRDYYPGTTGINKRLLLDVVGNHVDNNMKQNCIDAYNRHQEKLKEVTKVYIDKINSFDNSNTAPLSSPDEEPPKNKLSVFTNMQLIRTSLENSETFEITENKTTADILWMYDHFSAFSSISTTGQFINQFPGEKCIVVKDLLLQTITSVFGTTDWLPKTYNMESQLSEFLGDYYQNKKKKNKNNIFIVKPWNLARGIGHVISDNLNCIMRVSETAPKVASLYLTNPALFDGKKFDLRYVVLVKSIQPLQLFVYKTFLVRFANKPFNLSDFEDYEKHLTVMTFVPYELKEVQHQDFIEHYISQRPADKSNKSWEQIETDIFSVLKKTIVAACLTNDGLVNFPNSRAIYGADIILDDNDNPLMLEMNYCPNCTRLAKYEPNFFEDIFQLLFCNKLNQDKFVQL